MHGLALSGHCHVVAVFLLMLNVFVPAVVSLENSIKPNYDYDNYKLFDIKGHLILSCNVTLEGDNTLEWYKNGVVVSKDPSLDGRHRILAQENKFIIERTLENDAGNYSCKMGDLSGEITVVAKPAARLPPNTSVIEGEKLRILCLAAGKPTPVVEWTIGNETYTESRGRVELTDDNDVKNAILTIEKASLDDRGDYHCRAINIANNFVNITSVSTFVRVKDKLAALWPFLGICAEVFVLCTIILVYEKRRNKPELDESDTDQSPDQKHTPDHGKDRDVRHRK